MKEFCVYKLGFKTPALISIFSGATFVTLTLTYKEWVGILDFLYKTQNKKILPSDKQGFSGYDIGKNRIDYFSYQMCLEFYEKLQEQFKREPQKRLEWEKNNNISFSEWIKKERLRLQKRAKNCRKYNLDSYVYLLKFNIKVFLKKDKFIRFRAFCLRQAKKDE